MVYENAKVPERVFERHVQNLADRHVEALVEAGLVNGAGFGGCVVVEAESAAAVGFGIEVEVKVLRLFGGIQVHDDLAGCRKGSVRGSLAVAQLLNACDRGLEELAVFHTQLAGKAHAALPVLFLCGIVVVGQADPADQDTLVGVADVGSALGGVEVEAVVQVFIA